MRAPLSIWLSCISCEQRERSTNSTTLERACDRWTTPYFIPCRSFPTLSPLFIFYTLLFFPPRLPPIFVTPVFVHSLNARFYHNKKKKKHNPQSPSSYYSSFFLFGWELCPVIHNHLTECYLDITMANELIQFWTLCQIVRMNPLPPRISLHRVE